MTSNEDQYLTLSDSTPSRAKMIEVNVENMDSASDSRSAVSNIKSPMSFSRAMTSEAGSVVNGVYIRYEVTGYRWLIQFLFCGLVLNSA